MANYTKNMEFLSLAIFMILILLILAIVYQINIKKVKEFAERKELDEITKKYPSNIEICKSILKKLGNENVKIEEDKEASNCLYIAITNKIIIADVKNSYTRIQTIAHEALHSIQNRRVLLFNFIFSNIYLIYFAIVSIMAIFKILPHKMLFLSIFMVLGYTYYFIRSYLEQDAMTKARFVAEKYLEEQNLSSKEEIEKIVNEYDKLNDVGIRHVNYSLMMGTLVKTIIVTLICFIR